MFRFVFSKKPYSFKTYTLQKCTWSKFYWILSNSFSNLFIAWQENDIVAAKLAPAYVWKLAILVSSLWSLFHANAAASLTKLPFGDSLLYTVVG